MRPLTTFLLASLVLATGCTTGAPLDAAPVVDAVPVDAPRGDAPPPACDGDVDCSLDAAPVDAPRGDAPPPACDGDVDCPLDVPYENTSCHTGLSCAYAAPRCDGPQVADCVAEHWLITPPDGSTCMIGGFVPPSPERCRTPFMGTTSGTITVQAGPGFIWGPQGGAMLGVDLLVQDSPETLSCVETRITVRVDGRVEPEARYGLRLRCGASNGIFVVLSEQPCDVRPYLVEVNVEVTGVGSASTSAMLTGGQMGGGPPVCTL